MMRRWIWLVVAAIWVVIDQYSKYLAVVELKDKQRIIDVLPLLRWAYAENHGAAFSLLSGHKWLFLIIGMVAVIVLLILILKAQEPAFGLNFGYASILGGAIGNLYDRATLGYVRDMISVYYTPIDFYFAIFNIADMAISIGVGAIISYQLWVAIRRRNDRQ